MAWSKWNWAGDLERKRKKSDYLRENEEGARIGGGVGAAAGGVGAVVGIYAGAWAASAVVEAAVAAEVAAGAGGAAAGAGGAAAGASAGAVTAEVVGATGIAALTLKGVRDLGTKALQTAMEHTVYAAMDLGEHGGAYVGATVQAATRSIREAFAD